MPCAQPQTVTQPQPQRDGTGRDGTLHSAVSVWYVVALRSARPSGPRGPVRALTMHGGEAAAMHGGEAAAMRGGEALVGFDHSAQRRHVARECGGSKQTD